MQKFNNYCINQNTIALIPLFTSKGELYCYVIEGELRFIVRKSPMQIIEDSLLRYGGDYKGAVKAAKYHLGSRYMVPIKISGLYQIYIMPDQSPKNDGCVWVAIQHVIDFMKEDKNKTRVYLSNGHDIVVALKENQFSDKLNRAENFKVKIQNVVQSVELIYEQSKGFSIVKETGKLNYEITKKE
ncbi:competence protein ComK [Bacillus sp. JJ722]|uniref:competence protein ComK n=1 Tax=Bacillus sp. JJ722 TaxID=3122973 RepID=UPI002FFFF0EC